MSVLSDQLADRVAEIITRYSMLSPPDSVGVTSVGVAVSGGADSVVLLHILNRLKGLFGVELTVLHLNHQLRGAESDEDERFVRRMAEDLGLTFVSERFRVPEHGNLEEQCRLARRDFFARARTELGLQRVAFGHTRSDQAETVLFRLLRGSGLSGLAGMRPVTGDGVIRPLLFNSREEIREWARAEGIEWREDATNRDIGFARNRLRLETLPQLARDFNPNIESVLAGMAETAADEEDFWQTRTERYFSDFVKQTRLGLVLPVSGLRALHPAEQRRVLRRALNEIRGDLRGIDREHVEAILQLCERSDGHDRVVVPRADALRSFDELLLSQPNRLASEGRGYQIALEFGKVAELPYRSGTIGAEEMPAIHEKCANFKTDQGLPLELADLDGGALAGRAGLCVRNWEPGDQLHRPGHESPEKVKSLFQEHRIALWKRRHWPVVLSGQEIVWVRGFGVASKFRISDPSQRLIRLTYRADDRE